ncbi:MAG TPA: TerC family protein [Alphaproteobacteria bacterium]|nr:TerC family protein [Alphaproteobacteria bacterium]USO04844.1 MAG: TerC family protein [Rhodospirillales bacterium]HOO80910.1 TerC family protein [Alphaproteobacteria bacterium]
MDWLFSVDLWMSFLTLVVLEIILGIDNIIFLSIVASRLPAEKQKAARLIGLAFALLMRIALLLSISWLTHITVIVLSIAGHDVSWRDLVLGLGGLFLLYKGTREIHSTVEGDDHDTANISKAATFGSVITQIVIIDMVFSLDSVITAVGMTDHVPVMIAAVAIAIVMMMFAAEPASRFVQENLSIKMLALSFLLLVGVALIADAMHFHIPRGYLYFAIAFSLGVESLTLLAQKRSEKRKAARA